MGLDAGAPEVTAAAEDEGGWHGGAEEGQKREEKEGEVGGPPAGAKVEVADMEMDDEARVLAEGAMRAAEKE